MGDAGLEWDCTADGAVRTVSPRGRVDESTATAFHERLASELAAAAEAGCERLAIDLAGVDYMSSRGLRALTLAQRAADGHGVKIVLAGANPVLREILAISRYDMIFPVFDTAEAARAG